MRQSRLFLLLGVSLLILLAAHFLAGCSANNSPAAPAPTPTPTVVFNLACVDVFRFFNGSYSTICSVDLKVNGQPVTNAAVTLSGSFGSLDVPYSSLDNLGGGVTYATYYASGFTYYAGAPYTVTASYNGQSCYTYNTLPGTINMFQNSTTGAVTQATWTYPGNADSTAVVELNPTSRLTYSTASGIISPQSFPVTAYPDTTTGSTYTVSVAVANYSTTLVNGTFGSCSYEAKDEWDQGVTFP